MKKTKRNKAKSQAIAHGRENSLMKKLAGWARFGNFKNLHRNEESLLARGIDCDRRGVRHFLNVHGDCIRCGKKAADIDPVENARRPVPVAPKGVRKSFRR